MISYSKYKLLREAESPTPASPPATGPTASAPPPTSPDTSLVTPPPGFGGPPMGGLGGGGPSFDMGGLGGAPTGSASDLKPSGLKSSNVWDVLEKLVSNSSKKDKNAGV